MLKSVFPEFHWMWFLILVVQSVLHRCIESRDYCVFQKVRASPLYHDTQPSAVTTPSAEANEMWSLTIVLLLSSPATVCVRSQLPPPGLRRWLVPRDVVPDSSGREAPQGVRPATSRQWAASGAAAGSLQHRCHGGTTQSHTQSHKHPVCAEDSWGHKKRGEKGVLISILRVKNTFVNKIKILKEMFWDGNWSTVFTLRYSVNSCHSQYVFLFYKIEQSPKIRYVTVENLNQRDQ